uniref:Tail protein n=1 Tax=viral metagenome TaxID=1070528 RepID=A0A6M3K555_9ZZZZ
MSVSPVLSIAIATDTTYGTDRIKKMDHTEEQNSHKAEILLQDSDGVMRAKDLKGLKVTPAWGFKTSAGSETSATAPLWVRDQRGSSSPGQKLCTLSCIGIPDRLTEDKANDDYNHDASSQKTVLALITEVASGVAVPEDLVVSNLVNDSSIGLTSVGGLAGAGQSFPIAAGDTDFTVTNLSFRLKKTGLPTGSITFRIDDWDGNAIVSKVLTADAGTISNDPTWYTVTWTTPVLIDASGVNGGIWMWVQSSGGDAAKYVSVYYNSTSVKAGENYVTFTGATPLIDDTTKDCAYKYGVDDGSAGIPVFDHCVAWTVTDDTAGGDALLTGASAYLPADAFFIRQGESRLEVIDKLLAYTKTERRFEDDDEIHLRVPVTSGSTYDYSYALTSGHTFFVKAIREALVIPNKVIVESFPDDADQYTGYYTSATSYALIAINNYVRTKLTSNAQATAIATAMISRIEVASQRGSAIVPMNVGAELFDYVLVTDERAGDTRTGNIGYIRRHYDDSGSPNSYQMSFGFGGVATKSVPGTKLSQLYEGMSRLEYEENEAKPTWGVLLPHLRLYAEAIDSLQHSLTDILIGLNYYDDQQTSALNNVVEDASPQLGGDLDAQSLYKGINFVDPTTAQEVATKAYADTKLANVVEDTTPQLGGNLDVNGKTINELTGILQLTGKTGANLNVNGSGVVEATASGVDIFQEVDMNSKKITSVLDPTSNQDAATKKYVDDNAGGTPTATSTDVEGSRAKNTTYTNSTGSPVTVQVSTQNQSGHSSSCLIHASADPPTGIVLSGYNENAEQIWLPFTFVVPIGWKYRVNTDGAIATWWETVWTIA